MKKSNSSSNKRKATEPPKALQDETLEPSPALLPTPQRITRSKSSSRIVSTQLPTSEAQSTEFLKSNDSNHQSAVEVEPTAAPHVNVLHNSITVNNTTKGGNAAKFQNVSVELTSRDNSLDISRNQASLQGTPMNFIDDARLHNANHDIRTDIPVQAPQLPLVAQTTNLTSTSTPTICAIPTTNSQIVNVSPAIFRAFNTADKKPTGHKPIAKILSHTYTPMTRLAPSDKSSKQLTASEIGDDMKRQWRLQRDVAPADQALLVPRVVDPNTIREGHQLYIPQSATRASRFTTGQLTEFYNAFVKYTELEITI